MRSWGRLAASRERRHVGHHHQHAREHRLVAGPHSLHLHAAQEPGQLVAGHACTRGRELGTRSTRPAQAHQPGQAGGAAQHAAGCRHTTCGERGPTWSLRRMTSMVRGREPAGTCTTGGQQRTRHARLGMPAILLSTQAPVLSAWMLPRQPASPSLPPQPSRPPQPRPASLASPFTPAPPRRGSPAPWPSASPQR